MEPPENKNSVPETRTPSGTTESGNAGVCGQETFQNRNAFTGDRGSWPSMPLFSLYMKFACITFVIPYTWNSKLNVLEGYGGASKTLSSAADPKLAKQARLRWRIWLVFGFGSQLFHVLFPILNLVSALRQGSKSVSSSLNLISPVISTLSIRVLAILSAGVVLTKPGDLRDFLNKVCHLRMKYSRELPVLRRDLKLMKYLFGMIIVRLILLTPFGVHRLYQSACESTWIPSFACHPAVLVLLIPVTAYNFGVVLIMILVVPILLALFVDTLLAILKLSRTKTSHEDQRQQVLQLQELYIIQRESQLLFKEFYPAMKLYLVMLSTFYTIILIRAVSHSIANSILASNVMGLMAISAFNYLLYSKAGSLPEVALQKARLAFIGTIQVPVNPLVDLKKGDRKRKQARFYYRISSSLRITACGAGKNAYIRIIALIVLYTGRLLILMQK